MHGPLLVALSCQSAVSWALMSRLGYPMRRELFHLRKAPMTCVPCREVPIRSLAFISSENGSRRTAVTAHCLRCPIFASASSINGSACSAERRKMPSLAVLSSARHMTSSSRSTGACASARRQQWYGRQVDAHTLCPVDVMPLSHRTKRHLSSPLSKEHSVTRSTGSQPALIADAFLSCCASPFCQAALLSIFKQLSADHQCDILSMALVSAESCSRRHLDSYVAESLRNDSFSPAHWVRLVASLPAYITVRSLPYTCIAKRVLCSSTVPFASNDDACTFIVRVLRSMEAQGIPGNTITECLETCGLLFEARAYASSSSRFVPPPMQIRPKEGWGFGDAIHSMCALPEPPMRWFSTIRGGMPRVLCRYATLVLLRLVVQKWGVTDNNPDSRWRRFADAYMTTLEAASAVHFLFGEGNAVTAQILLPYCHKQQQIVTLMRYTSRVSFTLTLAALTRSVELHTAHRTLAHTYLMHRTSGEKVYLLFWAQAEHADAMFPKCSVSDGTAVELLSRTLSFGLLSGNLLRRCLHEVLPAVVLSRSHRSLAHLLTSIPAPAVAHVVNAFGALEADALSWWTSLYIADGNVDGAFAVLEATAARGRLPHMGVLVMLLEALCDDRRGFHRAVTLVRSSFSQVSDTVLRAFMERTAASITRAEPLTLFRVRAMHVLSALALVGATLPLTHAAYATAAQDVPGTAAPLLALAEVEERPRTPVPLHVRGLEGLIAATGKLGYDVSLRVDVEATSSECCGSWTSTPEDHTHPS
ncbi:hypothetical protein LSCM1_02484 [Leishmania martiniquensis]|uniref:Uncharacterized protein n=1 Tax=Leishmania martiniquensis TaxID=1580590 RepID=A0A836GBX4_9TRYP|nr:hypothetical protein LSCM1_02484 [Leishmania martiniquensis]